MAQKQYINGRWIHRYHRNMGVLQNSHCTRCVRKAHWSLLHQRRRIKDEMKVRSSQSLPTEVKVPKNVSAGSGLSPGARKPPSQLPKQRAQSAPAPDTEKTKKRKLSDLDHQKAQRPVKEAKKSEGEEGKLKNAVSGVKKQAPALESKKKQQQKQQPAQAPPPSPKKQQQQQVPEEKKQQGEKRKATLPTSTQSSARSQSEPPPKKSKTQLLAVSTSWPSSVGTPRVKGYTNPHNYCYRRSALQNLLCIPQFLNLLLLHPACKKPCVVCSLRHLATSTHSADASSSDVHNKVRALDSAIKSTGRLRETRPRWTSNGPQEDAFLFYSYLLETVERSAGISARANFPAVYFLKQRSSWTCQRCRKQHINHDADAGTTILSLSIAGKTLAACLDAHYRPQTGLEIRCDKDEGGCGANIARTRHLAISSAPQVLIVHLKRWLGDFRRGRKNERLVDVPETLDLAPWAADKQTKSMKYRLKAVVLHGGGLGSGHYVADVQSGRAGGWLHVSDESVSKGSTSALHRQEHAQPYILTYVKVEE